MATPQRTAPATTPADLLHIVVPQSDGSHAYLVLRDAGDGELTAVGRHVDRIIALLLPRPADEQDRAGGNADPVSV